MPRKSALPSRTTLLGRYLDRYAITYAEAARAIGVTKAYISMLASGASFPSAHVMWEIERWSRGSIPMQAWIDVARLPPEPRPPEGWKAPETLTTSGAA